MKVMCILLLALALQDQPAWRTDMQSARTEAAAGHKYILLNFSGSDWCGPCIRMHREIFDAPAFQQYAATHLVLVNADFPRLRKNALGKDLLKQNEALAAQYDPEGKFPYTVLIDTAGHVVRTWDGYPGSTPQRFIHEVNGVYSSN